MLQKKKRSITWFKYQKKKEKTQHKCKTRAVLDVLDRYLFFIGLIKNNIRIFICISCFPIQNTRLSLLFIVFLLSFFLDIYLSFFLLSGCLSVYLCVCLCLCLSVSLSLSLSLSLRIFLFKKTVLKMCYMNRSSIRQRKQFNSFRLVQIYQETFYIEKTFSC